ncbi:hypothetical protein [Paenibacillus sp. PL2-23]|uniref:hypothetical protein n=1 Tax=Paenibacillus sp. PL2-23 TaxID=2100729 RepID=UPI0030F4E9AD
MSRERSPLERAQEAHCSIWSAWEAPCKKDYNPYQMRLGGSDMDGIVKQVASNS